VPINITVDAESSGLLNESSIDYHASPYRLKKGYDLHCIGVERHDTGEIICFYNGPTIALDGRPYQTTDKLGYTYELNNYAPEEYTHKQLDEFPVTLCVYLRHKMQTCLGAMDWITYLSWRAVPKRWHSGGMSRRKTGLKPLPQICSTT